MTPFEPGDLVSIEFPYSDLQGRKRRPGLVLSIDKEDVLLADARHALQILNPPADTRAPFGAAPCRRAPHTPARRVRRRGASAACANGRKAHNGGQSKAHNGGQSKNLDVNPAMGRSKKSLSDAGAHPTAPEGGRAPRGRALTRHFSNDPCLASPCSFPARP